MTIELPDKELGTLRLTSEQARVEFAIGLYAGGQVSLGRAAKIAGMPKILFMREAGRRRIPMHYTVEDVRHDIEVVRKRSGR
jgi:predicted HTH domain antitoxin